MNLSHIFMIVPKFSSTIGGTTRLSLLVNGWVAGYKRLGYLQVWERLRGAEKVVEIRRMTKGFDRFYTSFLIQTHHKEASCGCHDPTPVMPGLHRSATTVALALYSRQETHCRLVPPMQCWIMLNQSLNNFIVNRFESSSEQLRVNQWPVEQGNQWPAGLQLLDLLLQAMQTRPKTTNSPAI